MWVKICGNTSLADARLAAEAGADAVGFVFAASPRRVTAAEVAEIVPALPASLEKIGVFVDAGFAEIASTVETCGLTGVQLHASANAGLAGRLRERFASLRILQVIHFSDALEDGLRSAEREAALDGVLVDSRTATQVGGTGIRFDWDAARRDFLSSRLKLVAAGGLSPANVREAIATLRPWGVDVVTGVEASAGVKDAAKVRLFVERARAFV